MYIKNKFNCLFPNLTRKPFSRITLNKTVINPLASSYDILHLYFIKIVIDTNNYL